jgi:thioesterase domain-containing protein/acyl carrier protein
MTTQLFDRVKSGADHADGCATLDSGQNFRGDTENELARIFSATLGMSDLTRDDNFWDLGLDSMEAISLIVQIEKKLAFKATVAMLLERSTVSALADAIDRPKTPDRSGVVAMVASQSPLPPLFLMHMSGGDLTWYAKLTAQIGESRAVYGLIPPAGTPCPISLELLAERHVASIRSVQPNGPYCVAGFCFGGLLAYEVARQLNASGQQVAMLGVIDYPFNIMREPVRFRWDFASIGKFIKNLGSWARDMAQIDREARSSLIAAKFRYARMRIRHVFDATAPLPGDEIEPCPAGLAPDVWQAHEEAWRQYRPQRYRGRMTLLRLKSLPILQPYDPAMGWRGLAAKVDVRLISGPLHGDALKAPHVTAFARELNEALADSMSGVN